MKRLLQNKYSERTQDIEKLYSEFVLRIGNTSDKMMRKTEFISKPWDEWLENGMKSKIYFAFLLIALNLLNL